MIENKLVQLELKLDPTNLERVHNYLNQLLEGLTLEEVRKRVLHELGEEKNRYDAMVASALALGRAAVEQPAEAGEVIVSGGANLIAAARPGDPEQIARMQDLLRALEEKEQVLKLLDRTMESERIQVFLGAETQYASLSDAAVVAAKYGGEDRPLGAIAVIGPTRMNYGKVMSVVDFTAALVTQILGES
jgi:heat-inducible transcriptional repressor